MTTLNPNTKRAQKLVSSYLCARRNPRSLYEVYNTCSEAKRDAWKHCAELCERLKGTHLCVTGHSSTMFSAGFETETQIVYITKYDDYAIPKNA